MFESSATCKWAAEEETEMKRKEGRKEERGERRKSYGIDRPLEARIDL